jgi:hypothetical protein
LGIIVFPQSDKRDLSGCGRPATLCFTGDRAIPQQNSNSLASKYRSDFGWDLALLTCGEIEFKFMASGVFDYFDASYPTIAKAKNNSMTTTVTRIPTNVIIELQKLGPDK